ncbi:opsin, ultraviolet-sensitive-like, partial [Stegodyphus dumicola]|uniref:opsin, ultraviolet-sensitive-like n=1 Tax=Stegodyphus dumicola TaxID=202533 RepID=UPI0015B32085
TKRMRKPSNYLVINLAISDILMLHKIAIFAYNSFLGGPAAGPKWCTYYGFMGGLSGTSAIMTIAMMSIERYMCVSRPLDPSSRMTRTRALIMVTSIWMYASIFSFMPLFGLNRYVPEGFLTSCTFDYLSDQLSSQIFVLSFFVAAWCVPMVIICHCYIGIVLSVCESQKMFMHHSQNVKGTDRNVENQKKLEIKLAKISFGLISMWTISWTPYATVALLGIFTDRSMITPFSTMIPALFCKTASVLDPFVYGLSNRQFKSEFFKRIISVCKSKNVREKQMMPSFIMRAMSVKSQEHSVTDENADIVSSIEEEHETILRGQQTSTQIIPRVENNDVTSASETRSVISQCSTIGKQKCNSDSTYRSNSETDNNLRLKSICVIPIPHVYMIETHSDIIRIKSRRSF